MHFLNLFMFVVFNAVSQRFFRDIDSSVFKGHQVISSNLVFLFKHSKDSTPS